MKSLLTLPAFLLIATASVGAQATKTPTKADSSKAPPASTAKAPVTPPGTKQAVPPGTKTANTKAPAQTPALTAAQAAQLRTPTIMREVYAYEQEGRRDPFISLLSSSTLRPTVADLRLTGILYDENGANSIAMMRDLVDNKQYRVVAGQTLGRMKVALIKRRVVIFSIEEFGMNRQDSLVLGDTTKVRKG